MFSGKINVGSPDRNNDRSSIKSGPEANPPSPGPWDSFTYWRKTND